MNVTFIRYRMLEKVNIRTRVLRLCLPKKWFQKYCFHRRHWRREREVEGEFQGIVVTVCLKEEWISKFDKKEVIHCLQQDMKEQMIQSEKMAFLLEGELYQYYEQVESEVRCYPYQCQNLQTKDKIGNTGNLFFRTYSHKEWLKFFFIEELAEYYRTLYGISKKRLVIQIIAGEVEQTIRVIMLLSKHLNYMVVNTNEKEVYEPIAEQLYEETGLSILFVEQEEEGDKEDVQVDRLVLGEGEKRHTTIVVNVNHLFPKAKEIRITQHGMWLNQQILIAILMENVLNEDGMIQEDVLQTYKKEYALYMKKVQ